MTELEQLAYLRQLSPEDRRQWLLSRRSLVALGHPLPIIHQVLSTPR